MANLNGALENKTIQLTENDKLLNKWRSNVLSDRANNLSRLVRAALRYYIKNGSACCIGRVHLTEQDLVLSERRSMCISLSDSPDIVAWFQIVQKAGVNPTVMIKTILYHSHEEVAGREQEWIPSSLELFQIEMASSYGSSVNDSPIQPQPLPSATSHTNAMHHANQTASSKPDDVIERTDKVGSIDDESSKKKTNKKKPRAYAFSGKHYKS